jgi:hypothetical protein
LKNNHALSAPNVLPKKIPLVHWLAIQNDADPRKGGLRVVRAALQVLQNEAEKTFLKSL